MRRGNRAEIMHQLFVRDALLETGWQRDVLIGIEGRNIASIEAGVAAPAGAEQFSGAAVPGVADCAIELSA